MDSHDTVSLRYRNSREERLKIAPTIAATALALAVLAAETAIAADIKVLASTAIRSSLEALAPQFEQASGHKLVVIYGASARLQPEIEKGRPVDLAILSTAVTDALIKQGRLVAATRIDIARSGAGVAVRHGAPRPDISTVDSFRRALLDAKALGYSETGAGAQFLASMFQRLGIAEEMKPKLRLARPDQPSLQALADGEIDLGLPQISEALAFPGVDLVGPLPPELQVYTILPAAVATTAESPRAAKALLEFLTTPAAIAVLKAKGLEPG
jgi:molybdate transport system substrate-binding protein